MRNELASPQPETFPSLLDRFQEDSTQFRQESLMWESESGFKVISKPQLLTISL